jgi:predicted enzyme related to lactoylglutathione lyase
MSCVTHFEIYAENPENLVEFYGALLGWQMDKVKGVDYWRLATLAEARVFSSRCAASDGKSKKVSSTRKGETI